MTNLLVNVVLFAILLVGKAATLVWGSLSDQYEHSDHS